MKFKAKKFKGKPQISSLRVFKGGNKMAHCDVKYDLDEPFFAIPKIEFLCFVFQMSVAYSSTFYLKTV
jgi:hypothetical protein